jgi:hypothetical protein
MKASTWAGSAAGLEEVDPCLSQPRVETEQQQRVRKGVRERDMQRNLCKMFTCICL